MITMRIDVTSEDAASPNRRCVIDCMVGRAMRRALPGRSVAVGIDHFRIDGRRFAFPAEVGRKIEAYTQGKAVEPFAFELPDEVAAVSAFGEPHLGDRVITSDDLATADDGPRMKNGPEV